MKCPIETRESAALLLAYCTRKLDPQSSARLEEHFGICAACREFKERQLAVWQALDEWEAPPVSPADFDRRLYQRIANEVSWFDRIIRPFRPLLARQGLPIAAAAGLMIVAGVLLEHPAGFLIAPVPASPQVEIVAPDQAEDALEEMEMMRDLNHLIHPDGPDVPKM